MEDYSNEEGRIVHEKSNVGPRVFKLLLAVFLLGIAGFTAHYFYWPSAAPTDTGQGQATEQTDTGPAELTTVTPEEVGLSGKIYFNDDEEGTRRSYLRVYDLATGEFSDVDVDPNGYDQNPRVVDESRLVYLHGIFDQKSNDEYPLEGPRTVSSFDMTTGENSILSELTVQYRRQMAVAADAGNIATVGLSLDFEGDPDKDADLTDYSVYVITNGKEKEIGHGFWPSWSAEGERLYFSRNDGIYRYDVQTENIDYVFGNRKWSLDFSTPGIISPDEKYFIGYDPGPRQLNVYRVVSVDPFMLEFMNTYKTLGNGLLLSPSFSNDGTRLLYTNVTDEWDTASVVVVDLEKEIQAELFDLEIENQYALFPYLFFDVN